MGDASLPFTGVRQPRDETQRVPDIPADSVREINVLVTGFGSFKSFTNNPSYLVASHLSRQLNPESQSSSIALKNLAPPSGQRPIYDPDSTPYKINVHVYPAPVKVAYEAVRLLIPDLISDSTGKHELNPIESLPEFIRSLNKFDYVLHIGLAAGRENYTLETVAHRDHYKLKDVDDRDGSAAEAQWRAQELPEILNAGWNKEDVLSRWEALTRQREDEYEHKTMTQAGWREDGQMTLVETARLRSQVFLGKGKRAVVKLSRDAGRYLCEFVFYTSLSTRWKESRDAEKRKADAGRAEPATGQVSAAKEKVGKVAFLHVPGGAEKHDIARGVRVTESAIIAIVGSWEDGYRNPDVYDGNKQASKSVDTATATAMYEAKSTGDR